jgi:hypothetical protein
MNIIEGGCMSKQGLRIQVYKKGGVAREKVDRE